MALLLETTLGDLVVDLDTKGSPILAKNILKLAKCRYYTRHLIYNVIPNRCIETGDPTATGKGGSTLYGLLGDKDKTFIQATGHKLSNSEKGEAGRLIVNASSVGSTFLVTLPGMGLDGYDSQDFYSVGTVTEDENNVLDKFNTTYCDPSGRPYADVRIERALVIHDPFDDPPGLDQYLESICVVDHDTKEVTRSPSPERPVNESVPVRMSASQVVEAVDSDNEQAIQEQMKVQAELTIQSQDKSRAVVLEMLGDLPDADIKAPENVLFICQLNPVTTADDLELIFARFDPNVSVEIIRDHESGNSLQYGFAEFGTKQAAEEAYFKMNNVLIDDRRIKVDFSQSVSKLWDKYSQKTRMPHLNTNVVQPSKNRRPSLNQKSRRDNSRNDRSRYEPRRDRNGGRGQNNGGRHRERESRPHDHRRGDEDRQRRRENHGRGGNREDDLEHRRHFGRDRDHRHHHRDDRLDGDRRHHHREDTHQRRDDSRGSHHREGRYRDRDRRDGDDQSPDRRHGREGSDPRRRHDERRHRGDDSSRKRRHHKKSRRHEDDEGSMDSDGRRHHKRKQHKHKKRKRRSRSRS